MDHEWTKEWTNKKVLESDASSTFHHLPALCNSASSATPDLKRDDAIDDWLEPRMRQILHTFPSARPPKNFCRSESAYPCKRDDYVSQGPHATRRRLQSSGPVACCWRLCHDGKDAERTVTLGYVQASIGSFPSATVHGMRAIYARSPVLSRFSPHPPRTAKHSSEQLRTAPAIPFSAGSTFGFHHHGPTGGWHFVRKFRPGRVICSDVAQSFRVSTRS